MKFLHTSDLHIGKRLNDISFIEDQIYVLDQIYNIAKNEGVDAVLIAGDIYQTSIPNNESMTVFNDFITKFVDSNIKVFAISGNHDAEQKISYFSSVVKIAGVYMSEKFDGRLQQIILNDEYGEVVVNLLPFIKPISVRKVYPDNRIESYTDAVKIIFDNSEIDITKRNVLLCHQFITGGVTSDSEEIAVGGLDNIDAEIFNLFDYVALGHLHRPQKILKDNLRYSGSPLKYSFSEINDKKSVTIVEMREKGEISLEYKYLDFKHDLRDVKGSMEEIMSMPYSEDYVRIIVTDELVAPDAMVTVSTVFPNMMKFSVENSKTASNIESIEREKIENKSVSEMFRDFYKLQNNDVEPTDAHYKVLTTALEELERERNETN